MKGGDYFLMVMIVVVCFLSSVYGGIVGAEKACKSVNLEWSNGKCMKVTREAV